MIHELRIYHVMPNKMPALIDRFSKTTLRMFEKHGIRHVGFWTVVVGSSNQDLYYMLAWDSLAEREQKWPNLQSDPEWLAAKRETESDGPLLASVTNVILKPTSFSAMQ